jgi:hypothetical protein
MTSAAEFNDNNIGMETKTIFYETPDLKRAKPKFKDVYKDGQLKYHYFYSLTPEHHLYLEVRYGKDGQIIKYIKHRYNSDTYYEYLTTVRGPDGKTYLKDQMYEESPYCIYSEENKPNGDYYLTVVRYNHDLTPHSSEYIVNGKIMKEEFYDKSGHKKTYKYPGGKDIKLYVDPKDQPDIKHRK